MKKIFTLMLVLSMVLIFFAACGTEPNKNQTSAQPNSENDPHPSTEDSMMGVINTTEEETKTQEQTQTGESGGFSGDCTFGPTIIPSALPEDLNFKGETVNILVANSQTQTLFTDDLNFDIINDAVYSRNIKVEEDLGVDLNWIVYESDGASQAFANHINEIQFNGTGEYDICISNSYYLPSVMPLMTYTHLYNIPYLEFSKPW